MKKPRDRFRQVGVRTRVAISVFIAFHLFIIVLLPNSNNWLGSKAIGFLAPYVNFFEFTAQWNFFAPDPGPPPIFVEWELEDSQGRRIGTGSMPEKRDPFVLRERQNRRIAMTRFMMLSDARTEQVMLNYLCRNFPEAHAVTLWRSVHSIPNLNDVASGERKIGDEVGLQRRWVSHSFCEREGA